MNLFLLNSHQFRAAVAKLAPEEPIRLAANCCPDTLTAAVELVGDRIRELSWDHFGWGGMEGVRLPPGLVSLKVHFNHHSEFDFMVGALKQCPQLQKLSVAWRSRGLVQPFFDALAASSVTHLDLTTSPSMGDGLLSYLQLDKLEELKIEMYYSTSSETILGALSACTRLKTLTVNGLVPAAALFHIPRSLTKLSLVKVLSGPCFDWSFLVDSAVTDLKLGVVSSRNYLDCMMPARQLLNPLVQLEKLTIFYSSDESLKKIAGALLLPGSRLRELHLHAPDNIQAHLVPALRDPRCSLTKLELRVDFDGVVNRFYKRLRLLALLQGHIRRRNCPLRRLPIEMFRLVGEM